MHQSYRCPPRQSLHFGLIGDDTGLHDDPQALPCNSPVKASARCRRQGSLGAHAGCLNDSRPAIDHLASGTGKHVLSFPSQGALKVSKRATLRVGHELVKSEAIVV